jgi:type IV secretion system protein VirB10
MAGTTIPAVMVGGINSDMPGMVIGQVAENVYDTATGNYLLIPQGARLIGQYDNSVSMGQTRVGVIWNRIVYPDAESIDLGTMEGADQGGYAGFHDRVNTHFWSKIGNALLISIAGAGVQLSQPQAVNGQNYNSQQIAAAALGQQFGELGQEYARAGLSIPDTLEIRPGYRFVVMVNKDMHLRPYVDRRAVGSFLPVNLGPRCNDYGLANAPPLEGNRAQRLDRTEVGSAPVAVVPGLRSAARKPTFGQVWR